MKEINIIGKKFGRLLVLGKTTKKLSGQALYKCRCDCGNEILTTSFRLRKGATKSCGCLHKGRATRHIEAFIGARFGKLVVTGIADKFNAEGVLVNVQCDCGKTDIVLLKELQLKKVQSCGCNKENKKGSVDGTNTALLNSKPTKSTSSVTKTKGVSLDKNTLRYQAYISFRGERIFLGRFDSLEEAVSARKAAEIIVWGNYSDENKKREELDKLTLLEFGEDYAYSYGSVKKTDGAKRKEYVTNKSGVKGVGWHKDPRGWGSGKWRARITVNSKVVELGEFAEKEKAIAARKEAEALYWGLAA